VKRIDKFVLDNPLKCALNGGGDGYGDTFERLMFYREIGISGSIGGRWFTPHGPASNWETFFGRWTPFIIDSGLIYDYTKVVAH